ncbi:MAG: pilus assembly protein [Burkholderiales bacterium]|nr:NeuD/PglB/VioB family sugar acetyltransferase [Burkholderiaceae bacterium]
MPTERILVVGAGGHAAVVLDALLASGVERADIVLADDDPAAWGREVLGFVVVDPASQSAVSAPGVHAAIGDAGARERCLARLAAGERHPRTVIHPAAWVSRFAHLEPGCFVAARAVVAPRASLAQGVIVNHGAIVDHDCAVGAFAHVAPNATLGGAARVGARVLVGAGANLLPGVAVGDGALVGAGAVVHVDVPAAGCVAGVPARAIPCANDSPEWP